MVFSTCEQYNPGRKAMHDGFRRISAEALKAHLHDGQEIALLDAREEATFDKRHLFMASCVPLSRLEISNARRLACRYRQADALSARRPYPRRI
jgi:hypothetical protein